LRSAASCCMRAFSAIRNLTNDADLLGGGHARQALVGLRQRDGVSLLGIHIGAHQPQHGCSLAVEFEGHGGKASRGRSLGGGRARRVPVLPDQEAAADQD